MSGLVKTGQVNLDQILSQDTLSQVGIDQIKLWQVKFVLVKPDRSTILCTQNLLDPKCTWEWSLTLAQLVHTSNLSQCKCSWQLILPLELLLGLCWRARATTPWRWWTAWWWGGGTRWRGPHSRELFLTSITRMTSKIVSFFKLG